MKTSLTLCLPRYIECLLPCRPNKHKANTTALMHFTRALFLLTVCFAGAYYTRQGFNIKSLDHDGVKLNVWDIGGTYMVVPPPPQSQTCVFLTRKPATVNLQPLVSSSSSSGQKTIRAYWRNYYEGTDALVSAPTNTPSSMLHPAQHSQFGLR